MRHWRVGSSSGSGASCAGRISSGTWRRFTRIRVQVEDRPRIESTRTSSGASSAAAAGYLLFHRSSPASAASLLGEFATTISGIFVRGFFAADLAREGATRVPSPAILRKCGGHGASPSPAAASLAASSSNGSNEPGAVDVPMRVTPFSETPRHAKDGEIARLAVGYLMPIKRRGHASIGQRAHRIRRARGAILRVLVVIEEHAVALLLPPFGAGQRRGAALDFARERQRGPAHLVEGPARMNSHIDMHAARTAGLGPSLQSGLLQQRFHFQRHQAHVGPGYPGARIEIDPQFVGMFKVAAAHGMGMQFEAPEIDDPRQTGGVVHHDFFRDTPGRKSQSDGSQPAGTFYRSALLVESFALGSVHEAFEYQRAVADCVERAGRERPIIADDIKFRELDLARKIEFFRMRDAHLTPIDREQLYAFVFCHQKQFTPIRTNSRTIAASRAVRGSGSCGFPSAQSG